ncbi:hypothetical protein SSX86_002725 [Deinandra increscens subsp. villosa]|uniref:Uncharacterized protein n=1 Tax=Deinandra increscens subsp. villosa TaxID=3103831 RepID=A0AAP0DWZ4_9ASTR
MAVGLPSSGSCGHRIRQRYGGGDVTYQVDLLDFIDWTGVEGLDQNTSHPFPNALKQIHVVVKLYWGMLERLVEAIEDPKCSHIRS